MTGEDLKATVRTLVEGLNRRDASVIDEIYDERYVGHDPDRPQPRTRADMHQLMAVFLRHVVPDGRYTIDDLVAEGDQVWWRWTFRGTHSAEFPPGVAATGKELVIAGVNLFRFARGKVVEDWVFRDTVGMLRQLGALPSR